MSENKIYKPQNDSEEEQISASATLEHQEVLINTCTSESFAVLSVQFF